MSAYFRLLRVQVNQRLGISAFRALWRESKIRALGKALLWLLVVLSVGSLVGLYTWFMFFLLPPIHALGMDQVLLGVLLLCTMAIVFFLGLFYLNGVLFFSKDTEFLAALPIPQRTVFAAKFSQVLFGELATCAVMLLPPFAVYGLTIGVTAGYWVRMIAVVFFLPCIPLAVSAVFSLVLMRFSALWRRRELVTIIGSVAFLVLFLLGQSYLTSKIPENLSQDLIMALISDHSALLNGIVSAFPPAAWAAHGLLGDTGRLFLFILASCAGLAAVYWLAGRLYYRGASAQMETNASHKKVRLDRSAFRRRSPFVALYFREWKTVLRSPIYALNGLVSIVMGPIILIIPKLFQGSVNSGDFDVLFELLESAIDTRYVMLLLAAAFLAVAMLNPAASTTLSREGKVFYLSRLIPATPTCQMMAKFSFGLTVSFLTMLFMGIAAGLLMGFSLATVGCALLLGAVSSVAPMCLSLLPDFLHPKLSWNSETEAIKQNANSLLGMLIGFGYTALLVFGCYRALAAGMEINLLMAMIVGASLLFGAGGIYALSAAARRSWRVIEG